MLPCANDCMWAAARDNRNDASVMTMLANKFADRMICMCAHEITPDRCALHYQRWQQHAEHCACNAATCGYVCLELGTVDQ